MGLMEKKIIFVILMLLSLVASAYAVNSNSKVLDGIEYYVQTDKATYQLGENIEMLYRITNLSSQKVTFTLAQDPVWGFWVKKDGSLIWHAPGGFSTVITEVTLTSGQSREFPELEWGSPLIMNSNAVGIGNYDVIGGLYSTSDYYAYTKVSVPIEIIPEPASAIMLAIGAVFLVTRRKHQLERQSSASAGKPVTGAKRV